MWLAVGPRLPTCLKDLLLGFVLPLGCRRSDLGPSFGLGLTTHGLLFGLAHGLFGPFLEHFGSCWARTWGGLHVPSLLLARGEREGGNMNWHMERGKGGGYLVSSMVRKVIIGI
jgi:hypothetical protein